MIRTPGLGSRYDFLKGHSCFRESDQPCSSSLIFSNNPEVLIVSLGPLARVPNLISISDLVLLLAMSAPFPEGWLEMPSHCWPWSDTRLSAAFIYLPPTSLLHLGSPMAAEIVDLE